MIQAVRLLLFIVIAVSLPFHGAYAVGVSQCAALQPTSEQVDQYVSHSDHGTRDRHDHDEHEHSGGQHGDDGTPTGSHCGSCSACGVSAAITGTDRHDFYSGDSPTPYPYAEKRLVSIASPRLDRPPLAS